MPPLVRGLQPPHLDILLRAAVAAATQVNAGAAHAMARGNAVDLGLDKRRGEEVPPKLEDGRNAQVALT